MISIICACREEDLQYLKLHITGWKKFADEVIVGFSTDKPLFSECLGDGVTIASFHTGEYFLDEILQMIAQMTRGEWVLRLDADEELLGDPERFRTELERIDRWHGDTSNISLNFRFEGEEFDVPTEALRVRGWRTHTPGDFTRDWEFHYVVDPCAFPRDTTRDQMIGGVLPHMAKIHHLRRSDRDDARTWKLEVLSHLTEDQVSDQHYVKALKGASQVALSLCVLTQRKDRKELQKLLRSVEGQFSEVVFTVTNEPSGDKEAECDARLDWEAWLRGLRDEGFTTPFQISFYTDPEPLTLEDGSPCLSDFSRARQFCFEQARGRWRMFLDSDDILKWEGTGPEPAPKLREVVSKLERDRFNMVSFPYEYLRKGDHTLLVHDRERLVLWERNGLPLWKWDGPLHEMLIPTEFNQASRIKVQRQPGDVFTVLHKSMTEEGTEDPEARGRLSRNKAICHYWLDPTREYRVSPEAQTRLRSTLGMIELGETGDDTRLRALIFAQARTSYGLTAGIDLANEYLEKGRAKEIPTFILPLIDAWPDERVLYLIMARVYVAREDYSHAAYYFDKAYFPAKAEGFNVRLIPYDYEVLGRIQAADTFLEIKDRDRAVNVIRQTAASYQTDPNITAYYRVTSMEWSDQEAGKAAKTLVHYCLSLDCATKAQAILDQLPTTLQGEGSVKDAVRGVSSRLGHLTRTVEYEDAYNRLNETDLVVGPRQHLPSVFQAVKDEAGKSGEPRVFIDVGCNTGWLCHQAALAFPQCRVYGIDVGEVRVDEARRRAANLGAKNCTFFIGTFHAWVAKVWDNGLFSDSPIFFAANEVLEHVSSPSDIISHASLLRADHIFLTVPDIERYQKLIVESRRLDFPFEANTKTAGEGREHVRCYNAHELVEELHPFYSVSSIGRIDLTTDEKDGCLLFAHGERDQEIKSRKPRVDILARGYVPWGPHAHEHKHLGGSEQAVVHLAPLLTDYEVHLYVSPLEGGRLEYHQGVYWHPESHFNAHTDRDLLVVWRRPDRLLELRQAAKNNWPIALWAHDVPDPAQLNRYHLANEIFALSNYQAELYRHRAGCEYVSVLQNGVVASSIRSALTLSPLRKPHAVVYGSSADRGLLHLLRMWPLVRQAVPDAELHACYSLNLLRHPSLDPVWTWIADEVLRLAEELKPLGFHFHGGLEHQEFLNLAAQCSLWAYPTLFEEISCIVAMETQACGCIPVCSDRAALGETVLDGVMVPGEVILEECLGQGMVPEGGTCWFPEDSWSPTYLRFLIDSLREPVSEAERANLSESALRRYSWTRTAELFSERFGALIRGHD